MLNFFRFKKAFDSVNYRVILKKLYHYGFHGNILLIFGLVKES